MWTDFLSCEKRQLWPHRQDPRAKFLPAREAAWLGSDPPPALLRRPSDPPGSQLCLDGAIFSEPPRWCLGSGAITRAEPSGEPGLSLSSLISWLIAKQMKRRAELLHKSGGSPRGWGNVETSRGYGGLGQPPGSPWGHGKGQEPSAWG